MIDIERWNEGVEGPVSEAAFRCKLERLGYTVSRYTYHPGTHFPEHSHGLDKIDAVVSGRFRMVIEGREVMLQAGDMVKVPRGTVHSAEVIGDEPVISLDASKD